MNIRGYILAIGRDTELYKTRKAFIATNQPFHRDKTRTIFRPNLRTTIEGENFNNQYIWY